MPKTSNGSADVTITKQTGTVLTVLTNEKYCDANHAFNISVQGGTGAANTASADVDVVTTAGTAGGTNIGDILGTKTATEPSSGSYIRMDASGSGSSKITGAGWMETGNLPVAQASKTEYFPVSTGTLTQNAPTINTSTGVVTATASVTAGLMQAGSDSNTLSLDTVSGSTITPTRSEQTAVAAGKYTLGAVKVAAIPSTYKTLEEVYTVGSLYATEDVTELPGTSLGFGTWTKVAPVTLKWGDLDDTTWNNITGVPSGIYVWRRTA